MITQDQQELPTITVTLTRRREAAPTKGDSPALAARPFTLGGSLARQDDGRRSALASVLTI